MEFEFEDDDLQRLASDPEFTMGFAPGVEKAFRKRIQAIAAAADERDLYEMKSHHFEKLKGDRAHQRSMRLNEKYRLIIEIRKSSPGNVIRLIAIEDYH